MSTTKNVKRASRSVAPRSSAWFKKIMREVRKQATERIRKAGKHVCVPVCCGTMDRITGRSNRILKRPVVVMRFYECKVCGRDMTQNAPRERTAVAGTLDGVVGKTGGEA